MLKHNSVGPTIFTLTTNQYMINGPLSWCLCLRYALLAGFLWLVLPGELLSQGLSIVSHHFTRQLPSPYAELIETTGTTSCRNSSAARLPAGGLRTAVDHSRAIHGRLSQLQGG